MTQRGDPGFRASTTQTTVTGLIPGTTYRCFVGAKNAFGGYAPVFDAFFAGNVSTAAAAPAAVDEASANCSYVIDRIQLGSGGGAPETSAPSLWLFTQWDAPRPNDATLNPVGPPQYTATGALGAITLEATNTSVRSSIA